MKELIDISMDPRERRRLFRRKLVRVIIPIASVFMMIAAIAGIATFSYLSNRRDVMALSNDLLSVLDNRITKEVEAYLAPASDMSTLASSIFLNPVFRANRTEVVETLGSEMLRIYPQLTIFSGAGMDGDFMMLKKAPTGAIDTKIIERSAGTIHSRWIRRNSEGRVVKIEEVGNEIFDPRDRPWYRGALGQDGVYWSDVYIFFTDQKPGITASMAVKEKDGTVLGVMGLDIELEQLSRFLGSLEIGATGLALIIDAKGQLVAYPDVSRMLKAVGDELQPMLLSELGDPVLTRAFNRFRVEGFGLRELIVGDRRYINTVSSLEDEVGRRWALMMVVPEEEYVGFVKQNSRKVVMMTSVIVLIASALAGLLVFQGIRADRNAKLVLDRKQELEAQSRAFSELASSAALFDPADAESLKTLTEMVSDAVGVRRVSLWHIAGGGQQLACDDCFDRESGGHTRGSRLDREDFPRLFESLEGGEAMVVSDAGADARTSELHRLYLEPLGCMSLLAVPITRKGITEGFVWFEHESIIRDREAQSVAFARAIAAMLALRLSADERLDLSACRFDDESERDARSIPVSTPEKVQPDSVADERPPAFPFESTRRKVSGLSEDRSSFFDRRLKARGYDQTILGGEKYADATVLVLRFTDPLPLAETLEGLELKTAMDQFVCHVEELVEAHAIDHWKIMTDQLVCASGLRENGGAHAREIAEVALKLQDWCAHLFASLEKQMTFRVGIDTGWLIGNTVGRRQQSYIIWGEAVRAARMMADTGISGAIQVSETAYRRLRSRYLFKVRGEFFIEDIGEISTYLLTGRL